MLAQRRPTTATPPTRERETFTWPPSTDELDAIEVIVLDDPPPAPRPRSHTRTTALAHWGLTLTSLAAILAAVALQFASWRSTPTTPAAQAARGDASSAIASAAPPSTALASTAPAAVAGPLIAVAMAAPPSGSAIHRPAPAFVPVRKPRARARQDDSRAAIDSPPLRLPESYVQPRLVSSGDRGRVRGEVVLGVQVRANGRVGAIDVLSGDGDADSNLQRAAVAAVKQWRYRPALRDGVPAPARLKVIVKFS
jgi:periplasmic protein TonB